jgi:CDP-diglyceride synthetase
MTCNNFNQGEIIMFIIRLFALAAAAFSAWITYSEWISLNTKGEFSMRYAVLAPLATVMSLFLFLFPKFIGKPETTAEKVIVMTVFALGVAAGLYNLYLMDPGMFGQ